MKRSGFLSSSATYLGVAAATAVPGGTHLVERAADFDASAFARIVGRPARIRQAIEAVSFHPQVFNNVKNALNGLQFGFGYGAHDISVAVCPHGPSGVYTYTDAAWAKYRLGEAFDLRDATGTRVTSNVYLPARGLENRSADPDDENGFYQDTSIQILQRRGVTFLTCHTAVEEHARKLVKGGFAPSGVSATEVADDLLSSLIPGAVVVPAMVAAIAVLQTSYHYSYLTLTF